MTIFEIESELPNGFHDAEIQTIRIDYPNLVLEITLDVWIGTMADPPSTRETYRMGRLLISGLQYCAMDMPDEGLAGSGPNALTIDLAKATNVVPPTALFGCRLWVVEWNGFIHIAAQSATFDWTEEPVNRGA